MKIDLTHESTPSVGDQVSVAAQDSTSAPRHRWYYFKEAFSSSIVSRAIEDTGCEPTDSIIDPFCGSGTVPLTALEQGYRTLGVEVNPFLAFVAQTKLTQVDSIKVNNAVPQIERGIQQGAISPLEGFSTFCKKDGDEKWLFNTSVIRGFEGGWISTCDLEPSVRDLIRLALIGAAMDSCNAVKDGKCLRYKSDWESVIADSNTLMDAFHSRVASIKEDLVECSLNNRGAQVRIGDSRNPASIDPLGKRFKLCITSPPYLNSFDYTDVYRPELFLGRYINNMEEMRALRQRTLRSHVQAKWDDPTDTLFGPYYHESVAKIKKNVASLWNKRIPKMVQAYFEDIKCVLSNLKRYAAADASVWIVVSTSAYAGVEIPVDLITADIGCQMGWALREVKVIRYLRQFAGQQAGSISDGRRAPFLRESVVILDATPRRAVL